MSLEKFLDVLAKRQFHNQNTTIIIVGDPRSGKSTWAFILARAIKNKFGVLFDPEKNIHFYARDLVADYQGNERKVIVLDDAGYQYDSQRWYTKTAYALKIVQETHGIKLNFLILTVQSLGLLLEAGVSLTTYIWDVRSQGVAALWKIYSNRLGKGFWLQNLHWVYEFDKLDDGEWQKYEAKKLEFILRSSGELDKEMKLEEMKKDLRFKRTELGIKNVENKLNPEIIQKTNDPYDPKPSD